MEPRIGASILTCQGGVITTNYSSAVQPPSRVESIRRCILILARSSALLERQRRQKEVEAFVNCVVEHSLPATQHLNTYRCAQERDPVCQQVTEYCRKGWPRKGLVKPDIAPFSKIRGSLTVCNQLLLDDHRIVVPKSLQEERKQKTHAGHQGIQRCRGRK